MSAAAAIISICCGPGLTGCAPRCEMIQPPHAYGWVLTSPGVLQLSGADVTITYDPSTEYYHVACHGATRSANTLQDAEDEAQSMIDKLRAVGIAP